MGKTIEQKGSAPTIYNCQFNRKYSGKMCKVSFWTWGAPRS